MGRQRIAEELTTAIRRWLDSGLVLTPDQIQAGDLCVGIAWSKHREPGGRDAWVSFGPVFTVDRIGEHTEGSLTVPGLYGTDGQVRCFLAGHMDGMLVIPTDPTG